MLYVLYNFANSVGCQFDIKMLLVTQLTQQNQQKYSRSWRNVQLFMLDSKVQVLVLHLLSQHSSYSLIAKSLAQHYLTESIHFEFSLIMK